MPLGVTFVAALLPAVSLIFTPRYRRRPDSDHHSNTYYTIARDCEVTTKSLRATRKSTFSDGTAPATSPSLHRHVAKSRSAVPSSHAASSYDRAVFTANGNAKRMRTTARPRLNCHQRWRKIRLFAIVKIVLTKLTGHNAG